MADSLRDKAPAALQHYQQEYGCSLLAVLSDPACRPYVRLHTVGGQQYALLLLDELVGRSAAAAAPAAPAAAALPLPIRLPQLPQQAQQAAGAAPQLGNGSGSSVSAVTTAAAANGTAAAGAAATSAALPTAQLVTTAAAAEAAVAELLAAAEVAVDCEGNLERDGAIALVQLYAGGEGCYVFDLAGMDAGEVPAAVGHLARLMESETTTKVGRVFWAGVPMMGSMRWGSMKHAVLLLPPSLASTPMDSTPACRR